MATMDIFEGDAFSIIELTRALENIPYKPATLSGSGLFGPRGVRSRTVVIESSDGTLSRPRVFAQFPLKQPGQDLSTYGGRPDGAAVDAEGAYWCAMFEGQRLVRLLP